MKTKYITAFVFLVSIQALADDKIEVISRPELQFNAGTKESVECSLNSEPFKACASPITIPGLADGQHSLTVRRSSDKRIMLKKVFMMDTIAPSIDFLLYPDTRVQADRNTEWEFKFSTTKKVISNCYLDEKPFTPCEAGKSLTFKELEPRKKPYTFRVEVLDSVGHKNTKQYSWEVLPIKPATEETDKAKK